MVVRFGGVEIDLDRIEIRVDGVLQPVQPQVFEVVRYLVEHRDRLVPKEELLDNVWHSRFVSETTLTSRIKSARRVLGDTGRDQRVIRTVHGRGYRFVAELDDVARDGGGTARTGASVVPAGADVPAGPEPPDDRWPFVGRYELLDRIVDLLGEPDVGGVVLVGPAGIGKTRLALESLRVRAGDGGSVVRVTASNAAAAIPLAALSVLVGPQATAVDGVAPELVRSTMFHRAVAELARQAATSGRVLVMLDDVDRLDELSAAVLAAAMEARSISVIATCRSGAGVHPLEELVRAGRLREIDVPPLDETDIDVMLYRGLGGPIDLASLERLSKLSNGWPGLLLDLVESSRSSGSLMQEDGVWRLVGTVRSSAADGWPPDGLAEAAVSGAELLSLVPDLHIEDAEAVIGSPALDALDAAGLLALERDGDGLAVRLADPLLAETIATTIGPIRVRRLRAALGESLARGRKRPRDLAAIVRWSDELDRTIDPLDALLAAQTALRHGDDDDAAVLVSQLDPDDVGPYPLVVRGELAYRRRQLGRSEQLFGEVDVTAIDEATAGFVLRRLATLKYQLHADYRGAIDWLADREREVDEVLAASLRAHRATLLTLLGCVDEALDVTAPLADGATGVRAIEVNLSRARALVLRGDVDRALALVDAQRTLLASVQLPGPESRLPAEAALSITLSALLERGDVLVAEQLLTDDLLAGARASRTWSPLSAAEVALEVGRPRLALEFIRPSLEMYRATGQHNGRLSCLAMESRARAELGRFEDARVALDELSADLDLAVGANRWFVLTAMARAGHVLGSGGDHTEALLDQADAAEAWGARSSAANLLALAAIVGGADIAGAVLPRVRGLVATIGGQLWPVRVEHLAVLAQGRPVEPVRQAYLDLGYRSSAALVTEPTGERARAGPA